MEIQCPCWCHHCCHHYCHYSAFPPADLSSAVADRACLLLNYIFIIREIRYYGTVIFQAVKYVPYLFHNTQFPLCMHHNIYPFCFVDGCVQCTKDLVTPPLQNQYHPHYCPFGRSHPRAWSHLPPCRTSHNQWWSSHTQVTLFTLCTPMQCSCSLPLEPSSAGPVGGSPVFIHALYTDACACTVRENPTIWQLHMPALALCNDRWQRFKRR